MAITLPIQGETPWDAKLNTAINGIDTRLATVEAAPAATVILNGAGAPATGTGAVGNYYEDTTNGVLYGPKAASGTIWPPTVRQLVGPSLVVTKTTAPVAADFGLAAIPTGAVWVQSS